MSNMTEHEQMLQSILTNEVDPPRNGVADTNDNGIEVLELETHRSTTEPMYDAVDVQAKSNEFENFVNESKRLIQVLCLWC